MIDTDKASPVDEATSGAMDRPAGEMATARAPGAAVVPLRPTSDDFEAYQFALACQRLRAIAKRLSEPGAADAIGADDRRMIRTAVSVIERTLAR